MIEARSSPVRLVVEGVGDVVANYYLPALHKLKAEGRLNFKVTFADNSSFWAGNGALEEKMIGIKKSVLDLGATYLDKNDREQEKQYGDLEADVVVVATPDFTHSEVAAYWLHAGAKRIFIEKPLDSSIDAVRHLLGQTQAYDKRFCAFDHYRARLLPARAKFRMLEGFLQKGIKNFTFYFLEDQSGDDPFFAGIRGGRQGPIENKQRVQTLRRGVILDLMPHVIAILAHFGRVETIRVTHIRPGKYEGVDGVVGKRSEIEGETFADVRFVFEDHDGKWVSGAAFVGKGIKGVNALGREYDRNVKFLRIVGNHGQKVDVDFRSSGNGASTTRLIDEHGELQFEFQLNPDPYYTFLEHALTLGDEFDPRLGLSLETGKKVLEVIEDMRRPIQAHLESEQITYPCGIYNIRPSPALEDLVERSPTKLDWVYGAEGSSPERAAAAVMREN